MTRQLRMIVGGLLIAIGVYFAMSPLTVASVLEQPHDTSSQLINLRASWGGPVLGLGALLMWLPALRPWPRTVLGVLLWSMAGVGLARAIGFALDGDPDARQWIWLTLEIAIVIGAAIGLWVLARRASAAGGWRHDPAPIDPVRTDHDPSDRSAATARVVSRGRSITR